MPGLTTPSAASATHDRTAAGGQISVLYVKILWTPDPISQFPDVLQELSAQDRSDRLRTAILNAPADVLVTARMSW